MSIPEHGVVAVWCVPLDAGVETMAELEESLSAEEIDRANRFAREPLRASYVTGRGALRRILAACVDASPAAIRIVEGHHKKPLIDPASEFAGLEFNVSHAGGFLACAVTRGAPIGVDIEPVRAVSGMDGIARRFFSPLEVADLDTVPAAGRELAFFRCWTRKEAYLKSTGDGLYFPLDKFRVSLLPDAEPALLELEGAKPDAAWRIRDLGELPGELVGALAWRGPELRVDKRAFASVEDLLGELG